MNLPFLLDSRKRSIVGRSLYADEQAEHYKREAEKLRAENATLKQQLAQYKQPTRLGVVEPSNSQPATSIPSTSPRQEAQQKIQQELTRLGVKLNSTLSRSIGSKDEQIVLTALKALEEAMETGTVENSASWLRKAIENQWEPNGNNTQPSGTNNLKLFNEWFPLAKSKGVVVASTQNNGEILVLTASEEWMPFSQVLTLHPLESLQ